MDTQNTATATTNKPADTFVDTAALDQLQSEAADALDTPAAATVTKRDASEYVSEAGMLIGMGLQILAVKLGVQLEPEVKEEGAKKLAAVLAKYNGVMPDWYRRYEEEFALGIWCAGVAWKCYEVAQQKKAQVMQPSGGGDAKTE